MKLNRNSSTPAILLLAMPFLLGAREDKWVALADRDLAFAREMAAGGARFDHKFIYEVVEDRLYPGGCLVLPSKRAVLTNAQAAQLDRYSEEYCSPWTEQWIRELQRCRGLFAPQWCNKQDSGQDLTKHIKISRYFDRVTTELDSEGGSLVRINIMEVVAYRLLVWPLSEFPSNGVCSLMSRPVSAYLKNASVDDALTVGERLIGACAHSPELAEVFRTYRDRLEQVSDEQRAYLNDAVQVFEAHDAAWPAARRIHERYGTQRLPEPPLDPTEHASREEAALLRALVQRHYELMIGEMVDGKVDDLWDEQSLDARAIMGRSVFERHVQWVMNDYPFLTAKVRSARVAGDLARVVSEVTRREGHGKTANVVAREDITFWVFENHNWFTMVAWPHEEWTKREEQAVDIPFSETDH